MNRVLPPITIASMPELGDILTGMLDCFMGLGITLANAGLIERGQIAEAMDRVIAQQLDRDPNASQAMRYPAKALRAIFRAPVVGSGEAEAQRRRNALRVIDDDRDPPTAA